MQFTFLNFNYGKKIIPKFLRIPTSNHPRTTAHATSGTCTTI